MVNVHRPRITSKGCLQVPGRGGGEHALECLSLALKKLPTPVRTEPSVTVTYKRN